MNHDATGAMNRSATGTFEPICKKNQCVKRKGVTVKQHLYAMAAGAALLLGGCAPSFERTEKVVGTVAWFDLHSSDPAQSSSFYRDMFGWRFREQNDAEFSVIVTPNNRFIGTMVVPAGVRSAGDGGANSGANSATGGAGRGAGKDTATADSHTSVWVPVFSVDDAHTAAQSAVSAGGRLLGDVETLADGNYATIRDDRGAGVTVYDGAFGTPLDRGAVNYSWIWADLVTDNPAAAKVFYNRVLGFDQRRITGPQGQNLTLFTLANADRAGVLEVAKSEVDSAWLGFVLVTDLDVMIEQALTLGATLVAVDDGAAILRDPLGASFGMVDRNRAGV
jgi:predicted enzyme related to lactoylglutathione lyase